MFFVKNFIVIAFKANFSIFHEIYSGHPEGMEMFWDVGFMWPD